MTTLRLTVDDQACEAKAGESVLSLLSRLGRAPPALCHDTRLPPAPRCRLCSVELEGQPGFISSCSTLVHAGMVLRSDSEALRSYRRHWLERLADHCREEDLVRYPDRALHQALREQGIVAASSGSSVGGSAGAPDLSHPLIAVDLARCISCQRCVRVCRELQGQDVWHLQGRGPELLPVPDSGGALANSHCVACGACVDVCPTAALTDRTAIAPAERWTRSVCPYCGVGCELELGSAGGRLVAVRPSLDAPVNSGQLCVKGRFGLGYAQSDQRLRYPMLRRGGRWERCSWDDAIAVVAEGLRGVRERHGPDAIGLLGSARTPNEDNYLVQKLARRVIGTNNVDCCARVCHAPSAAALKAMLGTGAATSSYDDIEASRLLLIAGANPSEAHPVLGARIRQQLRRGAAQAIVIDPRRTELAALARIHLAPLPGTDLALFNSMAQVVLAEGLLAHDFVAARVDGLDEFAAAVSAWTPERAAAFCGVPAEAIREAARLYASSPAALSLHGLGLTEQAQGSETVMALVNLALLCGQIGRPGTGLNPLRGQNNVQGSAHMGCEPGSLTGGVPLSEGRARFEAQWGGALPERPGLNLMQMLDAAASGSLRAMLVQGFDLALSLPDSRRSEAALQGLDLLVVQDLFLNATAARHAHVVLPAASSLERDGTFMNAERRVQRVRAALEPPGECLPDWQIVCALAAALGHRADFSFRTVEAVWDEVRSVWPDGAGLSYARLEDGGLQWPCRSDADPGTRQLHAERFGAATRARLRVLDPLDPAERPSEAFPMLLITGRNLYQFNAATMSGASALQALRPCDTLDMHPDDALRLGLGEGQTVRLVSAHGDACLPLRLDLRMQPGLLFASFHNASVQLNRVTGPHRDRLVMTPAYKRTAVRVVAGDAGCADS